MADAKQVETTKDQAARRVWPAWGVFAIPAVGIMMVAWLARNCFVDDAFTGFHYVANLVAGHGFVFHAGDAPVEGVTNIGWLLLLTTWSVLWEPTIVAKLAGLVLLLAALALTTLLGRKLEPTATAVGVGSLSIVPVWLLATHFEFVYFSLAGMETAFLAVILLVMALVTLRKPDSLVLPVLGALAFLVHPEAVAVYPFYVLLWWIRLLMDGRSLGVPESDAGCSICDSVTFRLSLIGIAILAFLVGMATAARFAYFHDWVPNTFYSKPSRVLEIVENGYDFLWGRNLNVAFWLPGWLVLPILWLGYRRIGRTAAAVAQMLGAITITAILFAIYSKPDWTFTSRYFAPYLPAAFLLLWAGLVEAVDRLLGNLVSKGRSWPGVRRTLLAGLALTLFARGLFDDAAILRVVDRFPGTVIFATDLVPPSKWMRNVLPADAKIATRRIGALCYYSGHPVFDYMYGLPDRDVARLVAKNGESFNFPTDPALAEVWRARAPGYLLEDATIIRAAVDSSGGTDDRFSIHGIDYRVLKRFPIGSNSQWVLAGRIDTAQ